MKILHTSDWHLGASLKTQKRYDEFEKVLPWLLETIKKENVQALLVAGDIFDTGIPPNRATELYFDFLAKLSTTKVSSIIITAGNHDSATYIEAPASVLKHLKVHVFGKSVPDSPESHLIPLREEDGSIAAIVAAIPFPRDRDIRQAVSGESVEEQYQSRQNCIIKLYENVCKCAKEKYPGVPLIATGHFYASGGKVSMDNEIGTLTGTSIADLPDSISYLALGHLHSPQKIEGKINCYYSGSLLQMSYGETDNAKSILLLDSSDLTAEPQKISVPVYQRMEKISGDHTEIFARIDELITLKTSVWLYVENTGDFDPSLQTKLENKCNGTELVLISSKNMADNPAICSRKPGSSKKLSELTPEEVFTQMLNSKKYEKEFHNSLLTAFREVVTEVENADPNAQ